MWFTNEVIAFGVTYIFKDHKDYFLAVSGVFLVGLAFLLIKIVRFDPIDADMIINEQAINLTSQHTETFRNLVMLEDFKEEMKSNKSISLS